MAALIAAALLFLAPGFSAAVASPPARSGGSAAPATSSDDYFKLDPFVVPVMSRTAVVRHLTFIVTLELENGSARARIENRLPILRQALNMALLKLLGVERADNSLPPISEVKSRMLDVTREAMGPHTVRAVLIESVYERRLR